MANTRKTRAVRIDEDVWSKLQKLAKRFNKRGRAEYIEESTRESYKQIFEQK